MKPALLRLFQLCDPSLPIGGFAHSAGLETYVQQGRVVDIDSACNFVTQMLVQNLQFTDAAFVSFAYDAAKQNDFKNIIQLDEECNAVKLPQEVRVASQKLGLRLLKIFDGNIHHPLTKNYTEAVLEHRTNGHYCIAFGLLGYAMKITKKSLLTGFYYNAAVGYISNCVKLIPLGQKDGQKILFELQEVLYQMVKNAMQPDREMIGLCCPGFDIRSMQHEQLYSRLYMS